MVNTLYRSLRTTAAAVGLAAILAGSATTLAAEPQVVTTAREAKRVCGSKRWNPKAYHGYFGCVGTETTIDLVTQLYQEDCTVSCSYDPKENAITILRQCRGPLDTSLRPQVAAMMDSDGNHVVTKNEMNEFVRTRLIPKVSVLCLNAYAEAGKSVPTGTPIKY